MQTTAASKRFHKRYSSKSNEENGFRRKGVRKLYEEKTSQSLGRETDYHRDVVLTVRRALRTFSAFSRAPSLGATHGKRVSLLSAKQGARQAPRTASVPGMATKNGRRVARARRAKKSQRLRFRKGCCGFRSDPSKLAPASAPPAAEPDVYKSGQSIQ